MEDSTLAKLPAELRNTIYVYALQDREPLRVVHRARRVFFWGTSRASRPLALTMTCKTIRRYTHLLFFRANVFLFAGDVSSKEEAACAFLSTFGDEAAVTLTRITLVNPYAQYISYWVDPRGASKAAWGSALMELMAIATKKPRSEVVLQAPLSCADGHSDLVVKERPDPFPTRIRRLLDAFSDGSFARFPKGEVAITMEHWRFIVDGTDKGISSAAS